MLHNLVDLCHSSNQQKESAQRAGSIRVFGAGDVADDVFALRRDLTRLQHAVKRLETLTETQSARITQLVNLLTLYGAQSERAGLDMSPLAAGISSQDLTWPHPFPDTVYMVIPTVIVPAANIGQCFVEVGAKTTDGCTIAVRNTTGGAITTALLDVLAIRT